VPSHVVAGFEDLARANTVYAPTTELLRALHELLSDRVAERTSLLTEQLRSPDPGSRLDAIRMSSDFLRGWRGDHTAVVTQIAALLATDRPEVCAEAAAALAACTQVAEPAREALAAYVTARAPQAWADEDRHRRRGHQQAVLALAQLGDARSVPSLQFALDSGHDEWRAILAARHLRAAADDLAPRLCGLLAGAGSQRNPSSILGALASLRTPSSIPVITDFLDAAAQHQRWEAVREALQALTALGPAAASSLNVIRGLAVLPDPRPPTISADVWTALVVALEAIGGDAQEVLPLALSLIADGVWYRVLAGVEVLGRLGRPAAPALPQLRELARAEDVYAATALWDVGGEPEAQLVLDTLLPAWEGKDAYARTVLACLDRMGPAAEPALPKLRAWLTRPRRGGGHNDNDEDLQRLARTIINRF
jgi:hypothetical protein